jgi:hypothetical protein
MPFLNYLDPTISLETRLQEVFTELQISEEKQRDLKAFLDALKVKDVSTYEHSLRVGLLGKDIASHILLNPKSILYPGLLHDLGKIEISPETLKKTEGWNDKDSREMERHVIAGFKIIRGKFDFSADVLKWHHFYQDKKYPKTPPKFLHDYSERTKTLIRFCGLNVSFADVYDALHRVNDKYAGTGPMTGERIKEIFLAANKGVEDLILNLYKVGVFTTELFI